MIRTKEAIVLAGGLGTRLQSVLPDIPKCMATIHGRPFLTYIFDYLISEGIHKVILSVGYRKDHIINYFNNSYRSLKIEYSIETEPLGTGGAIKLASGYSIENEIFILNGDTIFTPRLFEMEEMHLNSFADTTIAVKHLAETARYGLIISDESGRVTEFKEKDPTAESGWINGGIYLINKKIFIKTPQNKFSIEHDIFRSSCSSLYLQAYKTEAFFLDIGIPEDYFKAQTLIKASNN